MPGGFFDPPKYMRPGSDLTASATNDLRAQLFALGKIDSSGDLGIEQSGYGAQLFNLRSKAFWARITARGAGSGGSPGAAGSNYGFNLVIDNNDGTFSPAFGAFTAVPEVPYGTPTNGPAWEISGRTDVPIDGTSIVWMYPGTQEDTNFYFTFGGTGGGVHIVRLVASGAGVDGGTAWRSYIRKEVGGVEVDDVLLGPTSGSYYVLYADKAIDGSAGLPEAGDRVIAVPDPKKPGIWSFIPKKITDGGKCCDLSWIGGTPKSKCLSVAFLGGMGKCACIPVDDWASATPMVYQDNDFIANSWVSTAMKNTCCGCGMVAFQVLDADAGTAKLTFDGFHVACDSGDVFDIELIQLGCCVNPLTGKPGVLFKAKVADLPKTCNGVEGDCGQNFLVWVGCGDCPKVFCDCCCLAQTAPAWAYRIPKVGPTSFSDKNWNGTWVLTHDTITGGCLWTGSCTSGGSGSSPETDAATLQYISASSIYRLTHDGSVYELAVADWKCCQLNTMTRVSGTEGPATLTIFPLLPNGVCSECTPPDTITVEVDDATCPILNEFSATLTKSGSGSTATWNWSQVVPPNTSGVQSVALVCTNGIWVCSITGVCADMTTSNPWTVGTVGIPNTQQFGPFFIEWLNQDLGMTDPSDFPLCCNRCTGCVTITVSE